MCSGRTLRGHQGEARHLSGLVDSIVRSGPPAYDQFLEQTPEEQRRWFTYYIASIRRNVDPLGSQLT